jgi:hypothetical protein
MSRVYASQHARPFTATPIRKEGAAKEEKRKPEWMRPL